MLERQHIVIVTHELLYGAPQALRDYLLKKKVERLLFIGLPFWDQRVASCIIYRDGREIDRTSINRTIAFGALDYIIDFLQATWWVFKEKKQINLFIGVDPLNCLAGLLLKKLSKVKKVIFYTIDFVPVRFKNPLLNFVFHKVEKVCVQSADEIWNLSPRIAWGREKFLGVSSKKYKQKVVPIGVWNERIKKKSFHQIKKYQLLFIGHLIEKQGVQKVLEAVPRILKAIPNFIFIVAGGGEFEAYLRSLAKSLGVQEHILFTGWIRDREKLDNLLSESACAVATYKPERGKLYNFTYYADPTKIKDYLSAGLPVILTNVPYNAKEIEKRECGIVVKYTARAIASVIIDLLGDGKKLKRYRQNALMFAEEFDWGKVFDKAFGI